MSKTDHQNLNKFAAHRGDDKYIETFGEEGWRTIYEHDLGKLTNSNPFRTLAFKRHLVVPESKKDSFRTKLLHTIEVSNIADQIAKGLFLNRDLVKAIAYGHDIGHPPYAAIGEKKLRVLSQGKLPRHSEIGFRLAKQNSLLKKNTDSERFDKLRGVQCYDSSTSGICTISRDTLDGILKHTPSDNRFPYGNLPGTLEGQIVRMADNIAYITQEVEDAKELGLFIENEKDGFVAMLSQNGYTEDFTNMRTNLEDDIISNSMNRRINVIIERILRYNGDLLKKTENKPEKNTYRSQVDDRHLPVLKYDLGLELALKFIWEHFIQTKIWGHQVVKEGKAHAEKNIEKIFNKMSRATGKYRNNRFCEASDHNVMVHFKKNIDTNLKICYYIDSLTTRQIEDELK